MTLVTLAAAPALRSCPVAVTPAGGEQVYVQVLPGLPYGGCQGRDRGGNHSRLANNPRLAVAGYPIAMILKGAAPCHRWPTFWHRRRSRL